MNQVKQRLGGLKKLKFVNYDGTFVLGTDALQNFINRRSISSAAVFALDGIKLIDISHEHCRSLPGHLISSLPDV